MEFIIDSVNDQQLTYFSSCGHSIFIGHLIHYLIIQIMAHVMSSIAFEEEPKMSDSEGAEWYLRKPVL